MRVLDMNSLMREVYSPDCGREDVELPKSLNDVVEAGVVFQYGCYVFRVEAKANRHISVDKCEDRTAYESLLNHIHLDSHGDDRLPIAFAFLRKVSHILQRDFPGVEFLGEISSEPNGKDCVARFGSKHQGERSWLADDIEACKLNAVCFLDLSS